MMILWQNQDSHTCADVEVFHDITNIIIMEVSTSMMINRASQKCFHQGLQTRGIHRNGSPLTAVNLSGPFCESDNPLTAMTNAYFPRVKFSLADGSTRQVRVGTGVTHPTVEMGL